MLEKWREARRKTEDSTEYVVDEDVHEATGMEGAE